MNGINISISSPSIPQGYSDTVIAKNVNFYISLENSDLNQYVTNITVTLWGKDTRASSYNIISNEERTFQIGTFSSPYFWTTNIPTNKISYEYYIEVSVTNHKTGKFLSPVCNSNGETLIFQCPYFSSHQYAYSFTKIETDCPNTSYFKNSVSLSIRLWKNYMRGELDKIYLYVNSTLIGSKKIAELTPVEDDIGHKAEYTYTYPYSTGTDKMTFSFYFTNIFGDQSLVTYSAQLIEDPGLSPSANISIPATYNLFSGNSFSIASLVPSAPAYEVSDSDYKINYNIDLDCGVEEYYNIFSGQVLLNSSISNISAILNLFNNNTLDETFKNFCITNGLLINNSDEARIIITYQLVDGNNNVINNYGNRVYSYTNYASFTFNMTSAPSMDGSVILKVKRKNSIEYSSLTSSDSIPYPLLNPGDILRFEWSAANDNNIISEIVNNESIRYTIKKYETTSFDHQTQISSNLDESSYSIVKDNITNQLYYEYLIPDNTYLNKKVKFLIYATDSTNLKSNVIKIARGVELCVLRAPEVKFNSIDFKDLSADTSDMDFNFSINDFGGSRGTNITYLDSRNLDLNSTSGYPLYLELQISEDATFNNVIYKFNYNVANVKYSEDESSNGIFPNDVNSELNRPFESSGKNELNFKTNYNSDYSTSAGKIPNKINYYARLIVRVYSDETTYKEGTSNYVFLRGVSPSYTFEKIGLGINNGNPAARIWVSPKVDNSGYDIAVFGDHNSEESAQFIIDLLTGTLKSGTIDCGTRD